ncbi:hypothetical protein K1719_032668 [Acacia pycnantha]|nr:hypothetical protein K1719_032668 [Acacia pycnantha]
MVIESRDATFFENVFPYNKGSKASGNNDNNTVILWDTMSSDNPVEEELRRNTRQRTSTSFGLEFLTFVLENEPRTHGEAMGSPKAPLWKEAINSEIESILSNYIYELVDISLGNMP